MMAVENSRWREDPRLAIGAYLAAGKHLYCVCGYDHLGHIHLEDCRNGQIIDRKWAEVLAECQPVRPASSEPRQIR